MSAALRIYIPIDAAALSVGADSVAAHIASEAAKRGASVEIIRNGSRGMLWLEPLVEVETPSGRIAYGPVTVSDIASLFDANFLTGGSHKLGHGLTGPLHDHETVGARVEHRLFSGAHFLRCENRSAH